MNLALKVLQKLAKQVDGVDNGHCRICRYGYRYHATKGKYTDCSNPDCLSHEIAEALEHEREPMWTLDSALSLIGRLQRPSQEQAGFHISLSGGVLNQGYSTKDLDLEVISMQSKTGARISVWLELLRAEGFTILEEKDTALGPRVSVVSHDGARHVECAFYATHEDIIDDRAAYWHENPDGCPSLSRHLGWSEAQYALWPDSQ